jgi:hypothetical protein
MDYNTLISSMNDSMKNGEVPSGETKPIDSLYSSLNESLMKGEIPDEETSEAINNGADPKNLAWAKSQLGKKEYKNYCQAFVRVANGSDKYYGTAINSWKQQGGVTDLSKANPGDIVYFDSAKSNGNYGHTGIYSGNGKFISGGLNSVQEMPISEWEKNYNQKALGFIPQEKYQ